MSRIDPKFICGCSGSYSYSYKSKHLKTNKHKRWKEEKQPRLALINKEIRIQTSQTSYTTLLTYCAYLSSTQWRCSLSSPLIR